nr:hypothetical protein [Tanacetum cinerariifolium]
MIGGLEARGIASMATSSSETIFIYIFISASFLSLSASALTFSSNFCFLDLSNLSSSPALLELRYTLVLLPYAPSLSIVAMSADYAVTYTSVHSEVRSWSIPSEDPYEEAAQQLFEQAPHSSKYVPRDHVPVFVPEFEHPEDLVPAEVFVPEFEHPEDLVPAEGEAPTSLLPPGFLLPRIRPQSPRALEAKMNALGTSLYRLLHPSGTPPWLPISTPSTSRRARIPEADIPPQSRPLLATLRPGCEVGESSAAAARRQGPTMAHGVNCSYTETRLQDTERRMMAALELVNRRVSYQVE